MAELKLFATDMDGTFLRSDRSYDHARLSALIEKLTSRALIFCASSGRQLLALEKMFEAVKEQIAFVAENGAVVTYRGQTIFAKTIDKAQLAQLIDILHRNPYMTEDKILLSGLKGAYASLTTQDAFYEKTKLYYENVQRFSALDQIADSIFKVTTNFPPEHVHECAAWLNAQAPFIHATSTGFWSIDLIPAGLNKATGLAALVDSLHLSADNIAAFGDQSNDLEMLAYAGLPIAVSNAIPEIKALATRVIGSNDEDAVLSEMERLGKVGRE